MIRWSLFYAFLFAYRTMFAYAGQTVVRTLTKLGDAGEYQNQGNLDFSLGALVDSTRLTQTVGAVLRAATGGNAVLINVGFQAIGFIGLVVFLQALRPRDRRWAALLVLLPTFNLWTSVA